MEGGNYGRGAHGGCGGGSQGGERGDQGGFFPGNGMTRPHEGPGHFGYGDGSQFVMGCGQAGGHGGGEGGFHGAGMQGGFWGFSGGFSQGPVPGYHHQMANGAAGFAPPNHGRGRHGSRRGNAGLQQHSTQGQRAPDRNPGANVNADHNHGVNPVVTNTNVPPMQPQAFVPNSVKASTSGTKGQVTVTAQPNVNSQVVAASLNDQHMAPAHTAAQAHVTAAHGSTPVIESNLTAPGSVEAHKVIYKDMVNLPKGGEANTYATCMPPLGDRNDGDLRQAWVEV